MVIQNNIRQTIVVLTSISTIPVIGLYHRSGSTNYPAEPSTVSIVYYDSDLVAILLSTLFRNPYNHSSLLDFYSTWFFATIGFVTI